MPTLRHPVLKTPVTGDFGDDTGCPDHREEAISLGSYSELNAREALGKFGLVLVSWTEGINEGLGDPSLPFVNEAVNEAEDGIVTETVQIVLVQL